MRKIDLATEPEWLSIFYYGRPGSGKSTALVGACELGDVGVIDADNGLRLQALRQRYDPALLERLTPYREPTYDEVLKLVDHWRRNGPPTTVAIDTVTELSGRLLADTVVEAAAKSRKPRSDVLPFQDDYGHLTGKMRKIIRAVRDLPCHVVLTGHERRDDKDDEVIIGPDLTPKVRADVIGMMDVLCYMAVEQIGRGAEAKTWHMGHFVDTGVRIAKERMSVLPRALPNPSVDRIAAYVSGDLTIDNDPVVAAYRADRAAK